MDTTELPARIFDYIKSLNYRFGLYTTTHSISGINFSTYELLDHFSNDSLIETMAKNCNNGDVIYDIGSNIGSYSIALGKKFPDSEIHSFEPNPRMVTRQKRNIKSNSGGENIHIHTMGLSDDKGTMTFYISNPPNRSSFSRDYVKNVRAIVKETQEVPVNTIDNIIKDNQAPVPDAIKIDVEGHGEAVLKGAENTLMQESPIIFLEPHHTYTTSDMGESKEIDREKTLRPLIEEMGYNIKKEDYEWICTPS